MKQKHLLLTVILITSFSVFVQAKDAFNIKVQLHGVRDTFCLLANHFGDKQYIQDSARCDAQGRCVFSSDKPLREGMYLIVLPSKRFFEIIVDKQKFFSIEADTTLSPEIVKFKDSPDNDLFYDYLRFNAKLHKQMESTQAAYNALPPDKKKDSAEKKKIDEFNKQFEDYKSNVYTKYPKTMLAAILRATEEVTVPDPPKKTDGTIDSSFQYYYYKEHYFDGIDWSDYRLLRTPIINGKLEYYFSKLVLQIPDSVDKEADWVVNKSEADTEMFKFVTWFITHKYETSNIMGMDAVFVHMVKKYYTKEKAYWLDDAGLLKIQDRAKQLDPILVGKKCRNLILQDTSGVYQSMYDIKAPYTILFFWDPDCGHCQKAVPKVKEFYTKMHSQGVEIYGVCTETESDKWRKFISEKDLQWINVGDPNFKDNFRWDFDLSTTPQFFILDKNKTIIGKKLDVDQFEDFINHDKKKVVQ